MTREIRLGIVYMATSLAAALLFLGGLYALWAVPSGPKEPVAPKEWPRTVEIDGETVLPENLLCRFLKDRYSLNGDNGGAATGGNAKENSR